MNRLLVALAFFLMIASPTFAADLGAADKQSFKAIITGQLEAFKAGNGPAAYSYAAPRVTQIFPNVEIFMSMVQRGYAPVYRNDRFSFGIAELDEAGRPTQHVMLKTSEGTFEAVYTMELQADGTWKIAGCSLVQVEQVDV